MRRIETEAAQKVLLRAKKNRKKVKDTTGELIEKVLRGSHKTYRYILITALLAKSTNADIDALSLQAGDDSEGAYDSAFVSRLGVDPKRMIVKKVNTILETSQFIASICDKLQE